MLLEREINFESDVTLKGTVIIPEHQAENIPLVVIIHGSGPVDRDGNVKGMEMNAYKYIAEFFASLGIASLRYDKRGAGESGGDFYTTGMWDLVNDGAAAVEAVRKLPEINPERIFLLGHSEGAVLLPAINKKAQAAGLIFLAGQADNVRNASEMQVNILEEEVRNMQGLQGKFLRALNIHKSSAEKQRKLFDEIARSDKVVLRKGLAKVNAKWLREHFEYKLTEDLASVSCPVLAVTGSKDVQVDPQHTHIIAEKVNGPAEAYIIEDMNHILRDQEEPITMMKVKTIYKTSINKPLSPKLFSVLKTWTEKNILNPIQAYNPK